jgi:hypothetical protein
MKRVLRAVLFLALIACHRPPEVPVGQFLVRLDAPWVTPREAAGRRVRTAPATIISFRSEGEYFELHCQLIEQPDTTLYISSGHPHIAVVGRWVLEERTIKVVREKVARPGSTKVLCKPIAFRISGKSVIGDAIGRGEGSYSPVTRLLLTEIDVYISEAKQSQVTCPGVIQPKT